MSVTWMKKKTVLKYFFTSVGQVVAAAKNIHFCKIVIKSNEKLSLVQSCIERWKAMKAEMA